MSITNNRLKNIDALRGIACAWVLLHHALEHHPVLPGWEHLPLRALVNLANIGWLGVSLFLVLSGFCLHWPHANKVGTASFNFDARAFAAKRLRRILPPYYAAIAFSILLPFAIKAFRPHTNAAIPSTEDVFRHAILIHNWWPENFASINGTFWSLALECQLYVLFPLFLICFNKNWKIQLLVVSAIIGLLWQLATYRQFGASLDWSAQLATSYHALPARAFEFIMGMWAASVVAECRMQSARNISKLALWLTLPAIWCTSQLTRFGPMLDQIWGIIFAAAVIYSANFPQKSTTPHPIVRGLSWLGGISFSVYLIHRATYIYGPFKEGTDWIVTCSAMARIIIAVFIGYFFFKAFEAPAMKWAHRFTFERADKALHRPT